MIFFNTIINIIRRRGVAAGLVIFLVLPTVLPAGHCADIADRTTALPCITAEPWPEAQRIFRSDPRWLGGDGAATVDLGDGRVLWLFGDSFVDLSGSGSRRSAVLVRNTIAVQTGYDPLTAAMTFAWNNRAGRPAPFFKNSGKTWYWPASGIVLGGNLLVFLMEIEPADNALGFESCGWKAVWIDNPEEAPARWHLTRLVSPQFRELIVGAGSPVLEKSFLHVFAVDEDDRTGYLVRWPETEARSGILTRPQWWTGAASGWIPRPIGKERLQPVFDDSRTEFTVDYDSGLGRYLRIQSGDFLYPCLGLSTAPELTGPWTATTCFFNPPEQGERNLLIYAGKYHPILHGAERVFSYVVNTTHADRLLSDMTIYFPALVKGNIAGSCNSR